ncbi:hypothetical protein TELCIR_11546 [Teladorsagia circumcincta]|uniref:Uncharacterized protein n=1 Tax=Teladorsagia circumcincta TaxID=45464 RepID=A0A2G9U8Y2_TELCI|nr:hypothetical protein TELCIR_11546 [Teladorsagia circumcincta]
MAAKLREDEEREQKFKDRMAVLEKENFNLNISRDKASSRLAEEQKKIIELEQKVRELNKGIQSAQLKARSEQQRSSEKNGKLQSLTNKNAELANQNDELRGTCKALEEELLTTRAALEKKTNVSKQAMTDLLNNYKDSERKSMERATECEQLKAQLQSVSAKLERIEKRRTDLEARVEESELRNADLIKKIHQYERSARMALNVAGTPSALRGGQSIVDIPRAAGSSVEDALFAGYGDSFSMLRTTSSSHDLSIRTSPERAAELTNDLKAQQEEMQKNLVKTKEAVGSMQALERKVQDLQNGWC